MKSKLKMIAIIIFVVIISVLVINFFTRDRKNIVSGSITVLTDKTTYNYMEELAENYMNGHSRTKVDVKLINNMNELEGELTSKDSMPNIVVLNNYQLSYLKEAGNINLQDESGLINTYKRNFPMSSLQQVKLDGKEVGIPLTTRPLVLYLREDVLNQYGYNSSDIKTWDDFIKISKDIYKKSNGKYKGLSATGDDYKDLISLLIMQNMEYSNDKDEVINKVKKDYKVLKDNNILADENDEGFFAVVSSINSMKIIEGLDEKCTWTANNPPSYKSGGNRFFVSGGYNCFVTNEDNKNSDLIDSFLEYTVTNTDIALQYALRGELFPSYTYVYNNKDIEQQVKNFVGKSPLVVMANISEKAPEIKDYKLYRDIEKQLVY